MCYVVPRTLTQLPHVVTHQCDCAYSHAIHHAPSTASTPSPPTSTSVPARSGRMLTGQHSPRGVLSGSLLGNTSSVLYNLIKWWRSQALGCPPTGCAFVPVTASEECVVRLQRSGPSASYCSRCLFLRFGYRSVNSSIALPPQDRPACARLPCASRKYIGLA
jgi:hypothetical protein